MTLATGLTPLTGLSRLAAIISVLSAMAAAVLDASSVNIALPAIADSLNVEPSVAAWLVIAYQGALVAGLLPLAALGERFGYRQTFIAGTFLFGICAFASGLATGLVELLALRVLQGIGASAIMALGVALLRQTVNPSELGKAIGWNAMTVAMMSAAGPTIGAALLGLGSWRFVLAGSVVFAAVSLAASLALPNIMSRSRALDSRAILHYVLIIPTFVIAAALSQALPMASIILAVSGSIGVWLLVRRDRLRALPFLPLDLMRDRTFSSSVLASVACFTGISLALLMLPFALHVRLGASPFETAMLMTPWPLAVLLTTPITTNLIDRIGSEKLCASGGVCLAIGFTILALSSSASGVGIHLLGITMCGVGFGLFQTPNNRNMFLAAPVERAASAGGVQGTARVSGQMAGALIASLVLSTLTIELASVTAFALAALTALMASSINLGKMRRRG